MSLLSLIYMPVCYSTIVLSMSLLSLIYMLCVLFNYSLKYEFTNLDLYAQCVIQL